jgi:hypothetical protein
MLLSYDIADTTVELLASQQAAFEDFTAEELGIALLF